MKSGRPPCQLRHFSLATTPASKLTTRSQYKFLSFDLASDVLKKQCCTAVAGLLVDSAKTLASSMGVAQFLRRFDSGVYRLERKATNWRTRGSVPVLRIRGPFWFGVRGHLIFADAGQQRQRHNRGNHRQLHYSVSGRM
jgi:hypothetical protein